MFEKNENSGVESESFVRRASLEGRDVADGDDLVRASRRKRRTAANVVAHDASFNRSK
jgi:hypothetical protein